MSVQASQIIAEAQRAMNDEAGVRLPATALVRCLNMAQRDIVVARPDTTATIVETTLVEGCKQYLPASAATLLDIPANATGRKRAITKTDLTLLDATSPTWRSGATATEILQYTHDLKNPRLFYVYPPASSSARVDLELSLYPEDVPEPTPPGDTADTVTGAISLHDEWANALLMVTLFYAYLTDLEGALNPSIAAGYKQAAEQILGVQLQSAIAMEKKA